MVDDIRFILAQRIDHLCSLATIGRIDAIIDLRSEVTARVEINLEIFGRLFGLVVIKKHRLLADASFEVVPPIILLRICQIIDLDIEVCTQEVLVGRLADIFIDILRSDALLFWGVAIGLNFNALQKVCTILQVARNIARR